MNDSNPVLLFARIHEVAGPVRMPHFPFGIRLSADSRIRSMDEPTGVMILNDAPPSLVESNALSCEQRDLNSAQVPDAYTIHPLDSPEKLMCVMFPAGGSAAGAAAVIAFPVSDTTDIRFWATTTDR